MECAEVGGEKDKDGRIGSVIAKQPRGDRPACLVLIQPHRLHSFITLSLLCTLRFHYMLPGLHLVVVHGGIPIRGRVFACVQ